MLFQTSSSSRADGSIEAKFSEYAQRKFTPALLQCLHDRNVSLCHNHACDGWTCTPVCNALSLCWLQHSVMTVPGDHHVHLSSPEVVAPAVSHFLRTKVLLLPTSATHKLWSGLQKQPCCRLGIQCTKVHQELSLFQCVAWQNKKLCLIQSAGQEMSLTKNCQSSGRPGFIVYL